MDVTATQRDNEPLSFALQINFTMEELQGVLENAADPDEQLYFDIFSGHWNTLSEVERIKRALLVAELVEDFIKARETNPSIVIEDKGTAP